MKNQLYCNLSCFKIPITSIISSPLISFLPTPIKVFSGQARDVG